MPRVEAERGVASRVAACSELQDVRLFGAEVNLESPSFEGPLSYSLSSEVQYQTPGEPHRSIIVTGEYEVTVFDAPAEEAESDSEEPDNLKLAGVSFTLAALFSLVEHADGEPFADEEFEAFAATTGQFALYPYAREFVSDMTSRMGLPPLHMGVLNFDLDSRTGD